MNTTITFQVDDSGRQTLEALAKREGVSKSLVLRRMLKWQALLLATQDLQKHLAATVKARKLETEDDFERFLG